MLSKKFSNCQLFNKPKNILTKHTNKGKKMEKRKITDNDEEKENRVGIQNRAVPTVDLTKKIKKLSPKKIMKSQFSIISKPK